MAVSTLLFHTYSHIMWTHKRTPSSAQYLCATLDRQVPTGAATHSATCSSIRPRHSSSPALNVLTAVCTGFTTTSPCLPLAPDESAATEGSAARGRATSGVAATNRGWSSLRDAKSTLRCCASPVIWREECGGLQHIVMRECDRHTRAHVKLFIWERFIPSRLLVHQKVVACRLRVHK